MIKDFCVEWEGPQLVNSSLGTVNRYLCAELIKNGLAIKVTPTNRESIPDSWFPDAHLLRKSYSADFGLPTIHVRQQWPPSFVPSDSPIEVLFQPWEYGPVPSDWIDYISKHVDEVWVNSEYTKSGYVRSGVPADKVFSFPLGIDTSIYRADGPIYALKTNRKFKFLFVGGTIYRKGIDKVLHAYLSTFTKQDGVCLVIKDLGKTSYYSGQTYHEMILEAKKSLSAPEIIYIDQDLTPHEMAALYRACDCLVHPYRGEGFGLPILEGMACGVVPVIPDLGPAIEFTTQDCSYRVASHVTHFSSNDLKTTLPGEIIDTDVDELALIIKRIYQQNLVGDQLRLKVARHASNYSWEKVVLRVIDRINQLSANLNPNTARSTERRTPSLHQRITQKVAGQLQMNRETYARLVKVFKPGDKVLDFGSGDGTWLSLLTEYGVDAMGIECDPSIKDIKENGLRVLHSDVVSYVNNLSGEWDGLSMLHTIEHLSTEQSFSLLEAISSKLSYKGRVLILTPNFEDESVARKDFWIHPSRVRPYPMDLLTRVLQELGFRSVVGGKIHNDKDILVFASKLADDSLFV